MALTEEPIYIQEPTPLQCGQAVLAMLSGESVETVIKTVETERETTLKQMLLFLEKYGIKFKRERIEVKERSQLPPICMLSLETPKCWHWSLYFKGKFFAPEYGVLDDFPPCRRRYYWEIIEEG